jgi:hypothetical protein
VKFPRVRGQRPIIFTMRLALVALAPVIGGAVAAHDGIGAGPETGRSQRASPPGEARHEMPKSDVDNTARALSRWTQPE